MARDTRSEACGLFAVDLSLFPEQESFHALAFESPDDALRFVWLLRAVQQSPAGERAAGSAGLLLDDTEVSMGPVPPAVLAETAAHACRVASVLRHGALDLRPGQSAAQLVGQLVETVGSSEMLQFVQAQLRAGKL